MNKGLLIGLGVGGAILVLVGVIFFLKPAVPTEKSAPVLAPISTPAESASPSAVEETPGTVKEVTVTGVNFSFSPKEIKAKKGDTIKLIFKNSEGIHDFVIDEFEVATNQIGAEEEEEVEFVVDKTGTFEYYCSVGQHRKNGMVGKLIVE